MRFDKITSNSSRLNSYQFKLSQKIFGKRISLNLDREEAAQLVGLSIKKYTEIEQGIDFKSSKEKYEKVLYNLTHIKPMSNFSVILDGIKTRNHSSNETKKFKPVAQFKIIN